MNLDKLLIPSAIMLYLLFVFGGTYTICWAVATNIHFTTKIVLILAGSLAIFACGFEAYKGICYLLYGKEIEENKSKKE